MSDTPIYNALAIKYGWVTTTHHRWWQMLSVVKGNKS